MSAADIIREIKALPVEEQAKVIAFSKALERSRDLTSDEFLALVRRYQGTTSLAEAGRLEDEVVRAFYGPPNHAEAAPTRFSGTVASTLGAPGARAWHSGGPAPCPARVDVERTRGA
jgi:hypothetical protein